VSFLIVIEIDAVSSIDVFCVFLYFLVFWLRFWMSRDEEESKRGPRLGFVCLDLEPFLNSEVVGGV